MTFRSYRDSSRANWGTSDDTEHITRDDLKFGCMLRIADAVEKMAKNYDELVVNRDYWRGRAEDRDARVSGLVRSNNALRGVIKRMKNKVAKGASDHGN